MKKSYEAIFIALLLMVFPLTLAQAEGTSQGGTLLKIITFTIE